MCTAKIVPWLLTIILAIICWQQQQKIYTLENEKNTNHHDKDSVLLNGKIQKNVIEKMEPDKTSSHPIKTHQIRKNHTEMVLPNREKNLSEVGLEDMIEHRALELLEDIEEDKRQKRVEQLTDHMQTQVDGWAEDLSWSKEIKNDMMDIMTDYAYRRVEVHVLLKNETIDREGIRPYFQQIAQERNESIIELVGTNEFSEMEDDLHPRGGNK